MEAFWSRGGYFIMCKWIGVSTGVGGACCWLKGKQDCLDSELNFFGHINLEPRCKNKPHYSSICTVAKRLVSSQSFICNFIKIDEVKAQERTFRNDPEVIFTYFKNLNIYRLYFCAHALRSSVLALSSSCGHWISDTVLHTPSSLPGSAIESGRVLFPNSFAGTLEQQFAVSLYTVCWIFTVQAGIHSQFSPLITLAWIRSIQEQYT